MNKQLLRDFVTPRPALQELLKEALNIETTTSTSHSKNVPNDKDYRQSEETVSTNGQNNQLASNGRIKFTHNNINLKYKWAKCSNQKTQTGTLDKKSKLISVL